MRPVLAVLISIFLTACGGSGSTTVKPILTGYFTDSAVQGLNYATETQSGVTNALGAFTLLGCLA